LASLALASATANLGFGPSRKPDSALSRHPSPGGSPPGLLLEEPRPPVWESQTIWLARTGCLPGRPLAGYRRWALTPPFHPSPVPVDMPRWGMSTQPSAGLLSVALDVAAGLRHTAPRVVSPSGLSGSGSPRSSRVRTLLCAAGEASFARRCSNGSDGPNPGSRLYLRPARVSTVCQAAAATAGQDDPRGA
jgi:hypothetical protein